MPALVAMKKTPALVAKYDRLRAAHPSGKQRPTLFSDPPHCEGSSNSPTHSSASTEHRSQKWLDPDGYSKVGPVLSSSNMRSQYFKQMG